jgi:PAS domain S-box-containing protein
MSKRPETTVLIVADDTSLATLERRHLERSGYAVATATTAGEALHKLRQLSVDLILLSYRRPGAVDGIALYGQLRAAGYDLPAIWVNGFSNEATVIQALRAGLRDPVTKSVTKAVAYFDHLPEAVAEVLRQARAERQLAESEAQLAAIIDSAKDAIIIAEADRRVSLFNKAAERMFRCPALSALGQPLARFLPNEIEPASGYEINPAEPPPAESFTCLVRKGKLGVRADGETFPLEASVSRTQVGGRKFYGIVVRDISERVQRETEAKKLQAQLLHAQRMESIGRLAGGVAHDFNNLLTIISGYSEVLLNQLPPGDPLRLPAEQIRKSGERAAGLTRQILAFSRQQVLQPQVLDLNSTVAEMNKMLRRLIGEDIDLAVSLDPDLGQVKADPGQIEQVLINLAVNARDAMPAGGHLTIETRNVAFEETSAGQRAEVRTGPYVLLAVSDTGGGMVPEVKARIFEPFFTTKEVGKGTGLGLATVYGIVKQSGGFIEVYSEVGRGTAFKIYLPRVAESVTARGSAPDVRRAPGGTESVLLAEDEEGVRAIARMALQESGYTVLEAQDGDEALRVGQQHAGSIHLLVTDVVMPKMGGRRLADLLTASRPDLKVLYLSGYTDDAVVRHGAMPTGTAFLQKPFTLTALARKVREVLGQRPCN